jgi:hypothetical protein
LVPERPPPKAHLVPARAFLSSKIIFLSQN